MALPHLTEASAPLTREIETVDEHGQRRFTSIPAERPLTLYVDRRELVTLMTLGAHPEWLALGYLRNQRLVESLDEVASITVDWDVDAAAIKTRRGIAKFKERTAKRVVTTGCGQGSIFGGLMDEVESIRLPEATISQAQLYAIVNAIRLQESTYKSAGSVHACALFQGEEMLLFIEDVGRHNAIDTIAGWMWLQDEKLAPTRHAKGEPLPPEGARASRGGPSTRMPTHDKVFYTTGRLTSEMIIKSAQMGVAIVISRSGITQMGQEIAAKLGLCAIGRATGKHFLCYAGADRLKLQPELAGPKPVAVA